MLPELPTDTTAGYWQQLLPADARPPDVQPPWQRSVPVPLPDGRWLRLPVRALPQQPGQAVASLLVNHAALDVADALAGLLADRVALAFGGDAAGQRLPGIDLVVGLPTLGLALAPGVARALGHRRFVPLGYSRKFWYDPALSAEVQSITSPGAAKRVWLDPHLLPLVQGARVLLVDDAISTGRTAAAPWQLLQDLGAQVLGLGVAMCQGRRWQATLGPERAARVVGVFDSPLLQATPAGWVPRD